MFFSKKSENLLLFSMKLTQKNAKKWVFFAIFGQKWPKKGVHFGSKNPKNAKNDPQARVAPFFRSEKHVTKVGFVT